MKPPTPPSPLSAAARLAALRRRVDRLACRKKAGQQIRHFFIKLGIEAWPPSWDLRWHEWIGSYGDDEARRAADVFEQALRARAAQIEARNAAESAK